MSFDTEFGGEYVVDPEIVKWFTDHGFADASWHNNICPSFTLQQSETDDYIVEVFVDAQDPKEREAGPGPRFSVHWYDENGDRAEDFDFRTFTQVQAHFFRVMATKS